MPSKKVKSDSDSDKESKKTKKTSATKKVAPKKESSKKAAPKKESSKKVAPKKESSKKESSKKAAPKKESKGSKKVKKDKDEEVPKKAAKKNGNGKKEVKKGSKKPVKESGEKKKIPKGMNKTELIAALAEATEMDKKDVKKVLEGLGPVMQKELSGPAPQAFGLYGYMKVIKDRKKATPAREGRKPGSSTGETIMYKAKPARDIVRVKALKGVKDVLKN